MICPECKEEIDHLDFDVTGTCSAQMYQDDVLKGEPTDYDVACLTDEAEYDNFRCPECGENLAVSEEEAIDLLKRKNGKRDN